MPPTKGVGTASTLAARILDKSGKPHIKKAIRTTVPRTLGSLLQFLRDLFWPEASKQSPVHLRILQVLSELVVSLGETL
jgi:hypothetical protein